MSNEPWIGVDFDGTLAEDAGWNPVTPDVKPVPLMMDRVKRWLNEGTRVKIVTARAQSAERVMEIEQWCRLHVGQWLPVTNEKDGYMLELWDDRAVTVERNTGRILSHKRGYPCEDRSCE